MNQAREERGRWELILGLIDYALAAAFMYLTLHPGKAGEWQEAARSRWQALRHRVSVWAAVRSIRALPERR